MTSYQTLAAPNASQPVNVYLVFEGGGARGVAHIGAYQAIFETGSAEAREHWPHLIIRGVAGSSVGALVAALIAVGFKPNELIDADGAFPLAGGKAIDLTSLFPKGDRKTLARLNKLKNSKIKLAWSLAWKASFALLASFTLSVLLVNLSSWIARSPLSSHVFRDWREAAQALIETSGAAATNITPSNALDFFGSALAAHPYSTSGLTALLLLFLAVRSIRRLLKGLVSLNKVSNLIDQVLSKKLIQSLRSIKPSHEEEKLRIDKYIAEILKFGAKFKHLGPLNTRLRVVASDVGRSELKTFSRTETPETKLSDAITASIAIPIVFKRHEIKRDGVYQDGGLISNMPAWAFENLHNLDPTSWTIAISLSDPKKKPTQSRLTEAIGYICHFFTKPATRRLYRLVEPFYETASLLSTMLRGRKSVDLRNKQRVASIEIQTTFGLLDFEELNNKERVKRARDSASTAASILLGEHVCNAPARHAKVCQIIAETIEALLPTKMLPQGKLIRAIICFPHPNGEFLTILHGKAYARIPGETHLKAIPIPDDSIALPTSRTFTGRAFKLGAPIFSMDAAVLADHLDAPEDYKRRAVKDSIPLDQRALWRWAIPVHVTAPSPDIVNSHVTGLLGAEGVREGRSFTAKLIICIESNLDESLFGLSGTKRFHYEELFAAMAYSHIIRHAADSKQRAEALQQALVDAERQSGRPAILNQAVQNS